MKTKTIILSSLFLMSTFMLGCSEEGNVTQVDEKEPTEQIEDAVIDNPVAELEEKDVPVTEPEDIKEPVVEVDPDIKEGPVDEPDDKTSSPVTVQANGEGYIIFDNFENNPELSGDGETNSDNQTDLGASFNYYTDATDEYFEGGYWYAYDDAGNKGNSVAVPDYIEDTDFENGLQIDGNDGSKNCMHIKISLAEGAEYPFYGIGANIRAEGDYFDFSEMEAIEFYAKGSGKMKLVLKTKLADEDYKADWGDFSIDFTLKSEWTKYIINTEDIVADIYSDLSMDNTLITDAYDAVSKIHFQTSSSLEAGDEVDFYIDDIMIKASEISSK